MALMILALIAGCGSRKDAKSNDQSEIISDGDVDGHLDDLNDAPLMDENGGISTTGIIRDKSAENCGFLLEISIEGEPKFFEPLTLDGVYQVDGMVVDITYRVSRRPSTCIIAVPIVLDKIAAK